MVSKDSIRPVLKAAYIAGIPDIFGGNETGLRNGLESP